MKDTKLGNLVFADLAPAFRGIGETPSDYIDAIRDEVDRTLREAGGNRLKATRLGVERVYSSGLITTSDLKRLNKASVIVFEVDAGKRSQEEGAGALERLYREAVADPEASEMGATMVGVTYSARTNQTAAGAGLMGMIVGGLLTGGPGGALVGGLIGWTLGGGCKKDDD